MDDIFVCRKPEDFIPGLQLNRGFYFEVVKPLIDNNFPNLKYAAALIGHCSDVLGFDDYKSSDHVWGPRLQIFLHEQDFDNLQSDINKFFMFNLPFKYKCFPTNYKAVEGWFNNAYMQYTENYPINHFIEIETVRSFFNRDISINVHSEISFNDWMSYPVQNLLELTNGEVFYDNIGELTSLRQKLGFFPTEVILLRIFFLWKSIYEEQAFIGRCIEKGDVAGATIIICRILNKFMKLCFYYKKKYYPYSKWFGISFKNLEISDKISHYVEKATNSDVQGKMVALNDLYFLIVEMHNLLGITEPVEPLIINFHSRGYQVFNSEIVLEKINGKINWKNIKDVKMLSKIELFDDSYYGCSYQINKSIVEKSMLDT